MGGRSRQACEACRARKSRCLPGTTKSSCKGWLPLSIVRCEESRAACVPHQAIKRTAPLRRRRDRFAQTSAGVAKPARDARAADLNINSQRGSLTSSSSLEKVERNSVGQDASYTFGLALLAELKIREFNRWPACKAMSLKRAQAFSKQYKFMVQAVPFAIQLPPLTLDALLVTHSILLLATILTGSSSDPEFERQADELFRHVLADRVIMRGQKSLELLQSLLMYMTWYHHRFDPETHQFYQLLQLANGMIEDLGLPKKYGNAAALSNLSSEVMNEIRALLLCYYLNCGGGILGYDRAENMRCIESLRNAAKTLADISSRPLDKEAPAWVELLHVVACHRSAETKSDHDATSGFSVLQDWETAYLQAKMSVTLMSSFHFITAYTLLKSSRVKDLSSDTAQICVHHFQGLLSNILNQKLDYLVRLGIVEWAHLITTLFLLARLGAPAKNEPIQESPDGFLVQDYVGSFRSLLDELMAHTETDITFGAPHLVGWLDKILVAVMERANSSRASQEAAVAESDHQESAYELVNSFLGDDKHVQAQARQSSTTMKDETKVDGEDFWTEFMSDWLNW